MKLRDYTRFAQEGPINRATTFANLVVASFMRRTCYAIARKGGVIARKYEIAALCSQ